MAIFSGQFLASFLQFIPGEQSNIFCAAVAIAIALLSILLQPIMVLFLHLETVAGR